MLDDVLTRTDTARGTRIATILDEAAERFQFVLIDLPLKRYRGLRNTEFIDRDEGSSLLGDCLLGVVKMFEHLSARTRSLVFDLVAGKRVSVGTTTVGPFKSDERLMLSVIATNLLTIKDVSRSQLTTKIADLLKGETLPDISADSTDGVSPQPSVPWKVDVLRACSFRGLAPAGQTWEHEFNCESYLMYGPNGCGKSSLLGAISWCLTGRIFRDDCPPCFPSDNRSRDVGFLFPEIGKSATPCA